MATLHKYRLTLRGPIGSLIRGPGLWGHLCWAIRESQGEEALSEFIERHDSEAPPVILGDALPPGCAPRPLLPSMADSDFRELNKHVNQFIEDEKRRRILDQNHPAKDKRHTGDLPSLKQILRRPHIPRALFDELARTGLSEKGLAHAFLNQKHSPTLQDAQPLVAQLMPHVSISRADNSALEGQLFGEDARFPKNQTDADSHTFDLYAVLHDFSPERLLGLLRLVGLTGY